MRVPSLKVLGVVLREGLGALDHVTETLSSCSRLQYAIRLLKSRGLPPTALHKLTRATTVERLQYAAPTLASDMERVQRFLNRPYNY